MVRHGGEQLRHPGPGGYWFRPPSIAATAAASIGGGPSVSGNPWPRLIAPVRDASADISAKIVSEPTIRSTTESRGESPTGMTSSVCRLPPPYASGGSQSGSNPQAWIRNSLYRPAEATCWNPGASSSFAIPEVRG